MIQEVLKFEAILVNDDRSLRWDDVPNPVVKAEDCLVEKLPGYYRKSKVLFDLYRNSNGEQRNRLYNGKAEEYCPVDGGRYSADNK